MDSMEEIYKTHAKTVYGFLLTRTRDSDTAQELTQETFYRAVKQWKGFKGDSAVSTWLCGIARNVWLEYARKQKKRLDMERDLGQGDMMNPAAAKTVQESAEETHLAMWDSMQVLRALHNLKEPVRETMYLRLTGNLTFKQIGEIMGRSENWARGTFYRGKESILKEVKKDET